MTLSSLTIIGAGRLGRTLGRLAVASGRYRIQDVVGRTLASAREAADFIGAGQPVADLRQMRSANLILLSVPDAAIGTTAQQLADSGIQLDGAVVFHASGAAESSVLHPLRAAGARLGSLHPAFSFADPARAATTFAGTLCAIEGDDAALPALQALAEALGGRPFRLAQGGKAAYHAALSVASNYLVTLTDMAQGLAEQAGVPDDLLQPLLGNLMRQTLENALALGPATALTGPIVRGDVPTVARHLAVIHDPGLAESYRALARQTIVLAGDKLANPARAALLQLLDGAAQSAGAATLKT